MAQRDGTVRAEIEPGLGNGKHRRVPVDEPLTGAEADRVRDSLRSCKCAGDHCRGHQAPKPYVRCTCGVADKDPGASPVLHAGSCPVWAQHHKLI